MQSIEEKVRKLRVACGIAIDVSKSLAFFSSSDLSGSPLWKSLLQETEVHIYLDHLRKAEFVVIDMVAHKATLTGCGTTVHQVNHAAAR